MTIAIYSLLVVAATWVGGVVPLMRKWDETYLRFALSFGAGVILGAIFLHIIPDAIEVIGAQASMYTLLGFLAIYIVERFTMIHACEEEAGCDFHTVGLLSFSGFSLHNFLSGVALGSSLLIPTLGFVVFIAMVVHKAPESFSLVSILLRGGHPKKNILWMLLFLSFMIPLGAYTALTALQWVGNSWIGAAVAFAAGSFLHIALADLLPEVHRTSENRFVVLILFLAGLSVMAAAKTIGV